MIVETYIIKNTDNIYVYIYYIYSVCFMFICLLIVQLIPLHNTAALINICRFLINVVKFMQTPTKLDLPTLRKGNSEERTQRNK